MRCKLRVVEDDPRLWLGRPVDYVEKRSQATILRKQMGMKEITSHPSTVNALVLSDFEVNISTLLLGLGQCFEEDSW